MRPNQRLPRNLLSVALAAVLALAAAATGPARAATTARHGELTVTPGWVLANYDRDPLILPVRVTAPCTTTEYGSVSSTSCDTVRVELVHPSTPEDSGSELIFTADDGTGAGAIKIYGYGMHGFGAHTLRATNYETGETASTTVVIRALTRVTGTLSRTKRAPASATLKVTGTLSAFTWSWRPLPGPYGLALQRKVGGRWVGVRSVTSTSNGSVTWSVKVNAAATYRVCHAADIASTASCSSPRRL